MVTITVLVKGGSYTLSVSATDTLAAVAAAARLYVSDMGESYIGFVCTE